MREPDWHDDYTEMDEECRDCGEELLFNHDDSQYCGNKYCNGDLRPRDLEEYV